MVALATVSVLAILALGGLFWWVWTLRRELAEMRRAATANQTSGSERTTILEEANVALRQKNRGLQSRFNDLQAEFVGLHYSIAHDLRAPLRAIDGFSQALIEDHGLRLDGTAHSYLQRVREAARHLNALVDALLGLANIVRAPFQPETVDLSALAREIMAALQASSPARRVEWYVQPGLRAFGDRPQLAALLRHLLENAWKFSASRTVAHLAFRAGLDASAGAPTFEVRDDGVGFDPEFAGRLFGVFQRLHASEEAPGLGVGLAAVRRIVHRHGGSVRGTAEADGGAVFSFALPGGPLDGGSAGAPLSGEMPAANLPGGLPASPPHPKPSVV